MNYFMIYKSYLVDSKRLSFVFLYRNAMALKLLVVQLTQLPLNTLTRKHVPLYQDSHLKSSHDHQSFSSKDSCSSLILISSLATSSISF